jgi:hypothetical protein
VSGERSLGRLAPAPVPPQACFLTAAKGRGRRRPHLAVAGQAVGPELRADRDQRRQVGDGLDGPCVGDPHEAVSVEVVPEQERRVRVGGREQPRLPVVEEVALVDRLEPEGVALLAERREDGVKLALILAP